MDDGMNRLIAKLCGHMQTRKTPFIFPLRLGNGDGGGNGPREARTSTRVAEVIGAVIMMEEHRAPREQEH
jgi:hypothetical protein